MSQVLSRLLVWGAALTVIGGGGWFIWTLKAQEAQITRHLSDTRDVLAARQAALTLLEEERQKLADAYADLKGQWAQCDQDLQALTQASKDMDARLSTLAGERTGLQQDLARTAQEQKRLTADAEGLRRDLTAKDRKITGLRTELEAVASRSLTQAELEQVAARIADERNEGERLGRRILELTREYETLTHSVQVPEQEPIAGPAAGYSDSPRDPERASVFVTEHSSREEIAAAARIVQERRRIDGLVPQFPERERLSPGEQAERYWTLGESYFVAHQYLEAAEAFETSLHYEDHPAIHAKLVFIYGRMLHDETRAAAHRVEAGSIDPVRAGLTNYAKTYGLPRKSFRLVRRWLLNQ